jgi:hypothetical protein
MVTCQQIQDCDLTDKAEDFLVHNGHDHYSDSANVQGSFSVYTMLPTLPLLLKINNNGLCAGQRMVGWHSEDYVV